MYTINFCKRISSLLGFTIMVFLLSISSPNISYARNIIQVRLIPVYTDSGIQLVPEGLIIVGAPDYYHHRHYYHRRY